MVSESFVPQPALPATTIMLDVHSAEFDRSTGSHPWGIGRCGDREFRFDGWTDLATAIEAVLVERAVWADRPVEPNLEE